MSPLEILIWILLAFVFAALTKNKHNAYLLAFFGFAFLAFVAPAAMVVLLFTALEAIVLILLLKNRSRQDNVRKYAHYILFFNLLFVDFHTKIFSVTLETFAISFGVVRIFMTARGVLGDRKNPIIDNLHWVLVSAFYLPALAVGPVFSALDLRKQERSTRYQTNLRDHRLLLQGIVLSVFVSSYLQNFISNLPKFESQFQHLELFFGIILKPTLSFLFLFATFWGQSLIAEQTSKFFGYELPQNFNKPWKARSMPEFWQRWHRSMADFVMQFIYIPLTLKGVSGRIAAIASFVFMGLWHNVSLGYFVWGIAHGFLLISWPSKNSNSMLAKILNSNLCYIIVPAIVIGLSWVANQSPLAFIKI